MAWRYIEENATDAGRGSMNGDILNIRITRADATFSANAGLSSRTVNQGATGFDAGREAFGACRAAVRS